MFAPIHAIPIASMACFCQRSFSEFLSSETTKRIKEIALSIFKRITDFCSLWKQPSDETNLKAVALVSCLSLIALIVIAILRRPNSSIVPPNTPEKV